MNDKVPDLWPDDFGITEITTPVTLLRKQAHALAAKTKGLVEGEVKSSADGTRFSHAFLLFSPVLSYRYLLLTVEHTIALYPVNIRYGPTNTITAAGDEALFTLKLAELLRAETTLKLVRALIAQARDQRPAESV